MKCIDFPQLPLLIVSFSSSLGSIEPLCAIAGSHASFNIHNDGTTNGMGIVFNGTSSMFAKSSTGKMGIVYGVLGSSTTVK